MLSSAQENLAVPVMGTKAPMKMANPIPSQPLQAKVSPSHFGRIVVIKRSGQDSASFDLTDSSYLFGRAEHCDIRIQLASISDEHCRIRTTEGHRAILTNLSKEHGTLVNGREIEDGETILRPGDIITIVERSFRYEHPDWTLTFDELATPNVIEKENGLVESPNRHSTPFTPTKQTFGAIINQGTPNRVEAFREALNQFIPQSVKLTPRGRPESPLKLGSPRRVPVHSSFSVGKPGDLTHPRPMHSPANASSEWTIERTAISADAATKGTPTKTSGFVVTPNQPGVNSPLKAAGTPRSVSEFVVSSIGAPKTSLAESSKGSPMKSSIGTMTPMKESPADQCGSFTVVDSEITASPKVKRLENAQEHLPFPIDSALVNESRTQPIEIQTPQKAAAVVESKEPTLNIDTPNKETVAAKVHSEFVEASAEAVELVLTPVAIVTKVDAVPVEDHPSSASEPAVEEAAMAEEHSFDSIVESNATLVETAAVVEDPPQMTPHRATHGRSALPTPNVSTFKPETPARVDVPKPATPNATTPKTATPRTAAPKIATPSAATPKTATPRTAAPKTAVPTPSSFAKLRDTPTLRASFGSTTDTIASDASLVCPPAAEPILGSASVSIVEDGKPESISTNVQSASQAVRESLAEGDETHAVAMSEPSMNIEDTIEPTLGSDRNEWTSVDAKGEEKTVAVTKPSVLDSPGLKEVASQEAKSESAARRATLSEVTGDVVTPRLTSGRRVQTANKETSSTGSIDKLSIVEQKAISDNEEQTQDVGTAKRTTRSRAASTIKTPAAPSAAKPRRSTRKVVDTEETKSEDSKMAGKVETATASAIKRSVRKTATKAKAPSSLKAASQSVSVPKSSAIKPASAAKSVRTARAKATVATTIEDESQADDTSPSIRPGRRGKTNKIPEVVIDAALDSKAKGKESARPKGLRGRSTANESASETEPPTTASKSAARRKTSSPPNEVAPVLDSSKKRVTSRTTNARKRRAAEAEETAAESPASESGTHVDATPRRSARKMRKTIA